MKTIQLSPAQLTLLESFANMKSQEEADELSRVIRDYYARKLDEELEINSVYAMGKCMLRDGKMQVHANFEL